MTDKKTSEQYTPQDRGAVYKIHAWLDASNKHTKTALAKAAAISNGTVTQVLNYKYPSSPTRHLEAMLDVVARTSERKASPADIPFCDTSISKAIAGVIRRAHNDRDFGIFAGRVGIGKTVAIKRYGEQHSNAIIVEAFPGADSNVILRMLCERVGAVGQRRTKAQMTTALIDALKHSDRVVIVDEAETLTDHALLHLRRISDSSNTGVVLVGTAGLLGLVHDPDGKFGQITSRIGFWPPIAQSISEDDCAVLAEAYLGKPPASTVLEALWESCQGSARALRNLLRNSRRQCDKAGNKLTAAVVHAVDQQTMGGRRLAA